MHRRTFLVSLGSLALASCTAGAADPTPTTNNAGLIASPARDLWPLQYRRAPAPVQEAYAFALAHPEVLHYVPCFCGCGVSSAHRDNYDCFVKTANGAGSYILDPHGFGCGGCVAIALEAKGMLAAGASVKAIRRAIDERWMGVGTPTQTPPPD